VQLIEYFIGGFIGANMTQCSAAKVETTGRRPLAIVNYRSLSKTSKPMNPICLSVSIAVTSKYRQNRLALSTIKAHRFS
jgi:hypothetical protein